MTTRRSSATLVNLADAVLPASPVTSRLLVAREEEAMTTPGQAREAWNGVAAGYDEFVTPLVIPLAEQVLGRVDVRRGTRLLDVAAGSGALSLAAARLGAQVVATDIAPAMIERLQARAAGGTEAPAGPGHGRSGAPAVGRQLRRLGIAARRHRRPRPQARARRDGAGDQAGRE